MYSERARVIARSTVLNPYSLSTAIFRTAQSGSLLLSSSLALKKSSSQYLFASVLTRRGGDSGSIVYSVIKKTNKVSSPKPTEIELEIRPA